MTEKKNVSVQHDAQVPFHNRVCGCIGTGRMGLALQKEYYEQLKLVQEEIGFKHIRGHGLFNEDMAIYQEYTDAEGNRRAEYNFTYLDMVMDSYRELGLTPFLELGFMPAQIASGSQTIFYWKGNTTPPADYADWCALVRAVLSHLMNRYGRDEVLTWPIEVWNEPNLPGFWKDADMQEYFRLFKETFLAIKALDPAFQVGGPAICGVKDELWMRCFLDFCRTEGLAPDFITRHHYTIEVPEWDGHYGYPELSDPEAGFANLKTTRDITDSYAEFRGLPIHITEFNTSYHPRTPLHDTNQNAAYIAHQLSRLGDVSESYSYWTFGDIFEETGVPFTPFHGGFGLVANGCIPKPTFWTFVFFGRLKEENRCIYRSDDCVIVRMPDGEFRGIAWNSGRVRRERTLELSIDIKTEEGGESAAKPEAGRDVNADRPEGREKNAAEYIFVTQTVDEDTCNPLKLWHDMGEPASLAPWQKKLLKEEARPFIQSSRLKAEKGSVCVKLEVKEFGVVYFTLTGLRSENDRGFDYERAVGSLSDCKNLPG